MERGRDREREKISERGKTIFYFKLFRPADVPVETCIKF